MPPAGVQKAWILIIFSFLMSLYHLKRFADCKRPFFSAKPIIGFGQQLHISARPFTVDL
jgi:hypothetical protein